MVVEIEPNDLDWLLLQINKYVGSAGKYSKEGDELKRKKVFRLKWEPAPDSGGTAETRVLKAWGCKDGDIKIDEYRKLLRMRQHLKHDNIVKVHHQNRERKNVGEGKADINYFWIIMDYSKEKSLEDADEKGVENYTKYDTTRSLETIKKLGSAIEYLHKRALTHRDLKFSNIIVSGNEPAINDFEETGNVGTASSRTFERGSPEWCSREMDIIMDSKLIKTEYEKNFAETAIINGKLRKKPSYDIYSLGLIFDQLLVTKSSPALHLVTHVYGSANWLDVALFQETKSDIDALTSEFLMFHKINNYALKSIIRKSVEYDKNNENTDHNRYHTIEEFLFDIDLVSGEDEASIWLRDDSYKNKEIDRFYEYYDEICSVLEQMQNNPEKFSDFDRLKCIIFSKYSKVKKHFNDKKDNYEKKQIPQSQSEVEGIEKMISETNKEYSDVVDFNNRKTSTVPGKKRNDEYNEKFENLNSLKAHHSLVHSECLFGEVLSFINNKKDSIIIHDLKKRINETYDSIIADCYAVIAGNLAENKEESIKKREKYDMGKRIDIRNELKRLVPLMKAAAEYEFVRETLLNDEEAKKGEPSQKELKTAVENLEFMIGAVYEKFTGKDVNKKIRETDIKIKGLVRKRDSETEEQKKSELQRQIVNLEMQNSSVKAYSLLLILQDIYKDDLPPPVDPSKLKNEDECEKQKNMYRENRLSILNEWKQAKKKKKPAAELRKAFRTYYKAAKVEIAKIDAVLEDVDRRCFTATKTFLSDKTRNKDYAMNIFTENDTDMKFLEQKLGGKLNYSGYACYSSTMKQISLTSQAFAKLGRGANGKS
jgi:serine/threonine protein kinase